MLKLFPFIQANALSLYNPDSADLFHRTILTAYQCFKFKKFRYRYAIDPYNPNNPYGHVEQFKVDWHSLKEFKVQCLEENLASIYRDLIQVERYFFYWKNEAFLEMEVRPNPFETSRTARHQL